MTACIRELESVGTLICSKPRAAHDERVVDSIVDMQIHVAECHRLIDAFLADALPASERSRNDCTFAFRSVRVDQYDPSRANYTRVSVGAGVYIFEKLELDIDLGMSTDHVDHALVERAFNMNELHSNICQTILRLDLEGEVRTYVNRLSLNAKQCHEIIRHLASRWRINNTRIERGRCKPRNSIRPAIHKSGRSMRSATRPHWRRTPYGMEYA
jgi:hypothetical protein